jgi:hypothetical protein
LAKLSKRARRLAALKGARTRTANIEFKRRSEAAKKGWRTRRRRGKYVRLGYSSSKDNSFAMEIEIRTYKLLSVINLQKFIEQLLRDGHFDEQDESPGDLTWTAGLINRFYVLDEHVQITRGTAKLILFEREAP